MSRYEIIYQQPKQVASVWWTKREIIKLVHAFHLFYFHFLSSCVFLSLLLHSSILLYYIWLWVILLSALLTYFTYTVFYLLNLRLCVAPFVNAQHSCYRARSLKWMRCVQLGWISSYCYKIWTLFYFFAHSLSQSFVLKHERAHFSVSHAVYYIIS